jgi:NAD-dependent DNA ligase
VWQLRSAVLLLVAGGKVGASKLAKAEKFGTEVIDEVKLVELIN